MLECMRAWFERDQHTGPECDCPYGGLAVPAHMPFCSWWAAA